MSSTSSVTTTTSTILALSLLLCILLTLVTVCGNWLMVSVPVPVEVQAQVASWYDYSINGKWISKTRHTCASRDLPRYSYAKVTNIDNGKSVICWVNDWIEHPERHIDLSSKAFKAIASLKQGLIKVKIERIEL
jgi:rare lipoprotein A (peptidoglycan hydrolase)